MMRERKISDWNGKSGRRLLIAQLVLAAAIGFCSLGMLSAIASAQDFGPKPLPPLAPVLSEAVPPDQLADAIDPEAMRELNDATVDELLSGGRAAFEDGRHQDAQIFFEHLISRFSRTKEASKARRYLAALYATLPEPAVGVSAGRVKAAASNGPGLPKAGMSMLGGDVQRAQDDGRLRSGARVGTEDRDGSPGSTSNQMSVSSDFAASSQYQNSVDEFLTERLRLDVGDRVFFSASSTALGARARGVLSGQAKWLIERPNLNTVVAGHADEQGSPKFNEEISALRAQAVRLRLIEEGVGAERISVAALGRKEPVSPCGTSACSTQNRRAVLVIVNGQPMGSDWRPSRPRQDDRALPDSPRAW